MAQDYHSGDTRPAHQRLDTLKPRHLYNILLRLHGRDPKYGIDYTAASDYATQGDTYSGVMALARLIQNWRPEQIDSVHAELCAEYNRGGYKRRGRPKGSKNKPKSTNTNSQFIDLEKEFDTGSAGTVETKPETTNQQQKGAITEADLQRVVGALGQSLRQYIDAGDLDNRRAISDLASTLNVLNSKIGAITDNRPTIVELRKPDLPEIKLGLQHKRFPVLLKMCAAALRDKSKLNVWVHGPAGTGKTTAAVNVAKALNLAFHYNGALETKYELTGFIDANGKIVETAFRRAWINGGVYLFDEIDASMPGALLALNGALANGLASFPDGVYPRHPDCIIIAGANTTGMGGTLEYIGRMKQDAALTDRFVFLSWPIDEALEDSLCANKDWVANVRQFRKNLATNPIKGHMITPRATFYGEVLLAAGLELSEVIESVIYKGLSAAQIAQISK